MSYIMKGFIITEIISVINIISIFLIFSFNIKFILNNRLIIVLRSRDGVHTSKRYNIKNISIIKCFNILLWLTLFR